MHTNKNFEMKALFNFTNTSIDYCEPKHQNVIRITC